MDMLLTLAVGLAGGLLGIWLRLPAGALMGSMIAVALLGLAGGVDTQPVPQIFRDIAKILIGTVVGSTITLATLQEIRHVALPALLIMLFMIGAGLLAGWLLSLMTRIDIATALFAAAPGGSAEMTAASEDMRADARLVAALQAVRIVMVILIVPALLRWWFKS